MHRTHKKMLALAIILLLGVFAAGGGPAVRAEGNVTLFTPYTNIDVSPGQSVNYSIDVINDTSTTQTVALSLEGVPDGWKAKLTAGGWNISELAVKPKSTQNLSLDLDVPLKVDKGSYSFAVIAGNARLPLTVRVTEQGTYNTELKTDQPNMQGHADSTFTYSLTLKNSTADKQTYALTSGADRGWDVQFKVDGNSVSSVTVDAGASKSISVEVHPPNQVKADTYKIPVKATSGNITAQVDLEAVVTGTYKVELSTPSGLLSTSVTAGSTKTVELQVTNKGSSPLSELEMKSTPPANWEVTFDPQKITRLDAGQSTTVKATIKADKKAIAGDYVTGMSVSSPEASADAQFRVTVKTSVLWGWLGVLIILLVIGFVYYLFRTYGRR